MKKLAAIAITILFYLLNPLAVFATPPSDLDISIFNTTGQGINPNTPPGTVISNIVVIIFVVGIIAVLFMLVIGAFNWITSGGDKEAVGKARQRIINALIGLLVLALAFLVAKVAGQVVKIDIFHLTVPSLDKP